MPRLLSFHQSRAALFLAVEDFLIDRIGGQHFSRRAIAADLAAIQHQHMIGIFNARNTLRNDKDGGAGDLFGKAAADLGVRRRINRRGRVIQNQDLGLFQQGAGNAQALLLAARNVGAALLDVGFVFIGEALNKFIGAGLRQASSSSSWLAFSLPQRRFSAIVPLNSSFFCSTIATLLRRVSMS